MVDSSKQSSQSPNSNASGKPPPPGSGRQRIISSCLTCRRRKVRCDHVHPICGACSRGSHVCTYATDPALHQLSSGRVAKPTLSVNGKGLRGGSDVQSRLDRLELLLEKAVAGQTVPFRGTGEAKGEHERNEKRDPETQLSPSSNSQSSHGAGISCDTHDGTLLLDEGQSQFVSSLHYSLLAEEIQDIRALLGDKPSDEDRDRPTRNNLVHLLSLGRARIGITLQQLLPQSQQQRDALLDIYFASVDPMIRVTHKPTLLRKFSYLVQENHPIVWSVFFSAINSLPPAACEKQFGENKEDLLARYELGVEISLARENYLTTSSIEVLQGLVLWLTCITKEDDMGKAWALLGVTIRIALNQGLHRDPSLFPIGSMDAVTIELRRRLWHQICHLEYRAAECKGQEPSISDEDFTTMLPRNIEDEELVEGASPGPAAYDEEKFTNMTFQLVRFVGMRSLRRIVQSTYRLERRMLESGLHGTSAPDPVQELQNIFVQIKTMVNDMHEESHRKYLQYLNAEIALQRLCLGLASLLEWRCYLLFWLRMPRAYRDVVFSDDIRKSIFEKSVNCVETLNGASVDVDAARFQWHIGGHATFQAIMHILSELRNPLFDTPDRQRALRALQMSRLLKEDNKTKAWSVVKSMIDKVLAEQAGFCGQERSESQGSSSSYVSPAPATTMNNPDHTDLPIYIDHMPQYAIRHAPDTFSTPAAQSVAQPQAEPQSQSQPETEQQHPPSSLPQYNWDDINFNNIVGDIPTASAELPEFDWGFWGDPVNFTDPIDLTFPMTTDPYAQFPSEQKPLY